MFLGFENLLRVLVVVFLFSFYRNQQVGQLVFEILCFLTFSRFLGFFLNFKFVYGSWQIYVIDHGFTSSVINF